MNSEEQSRAKIYIVEMVVQLERMARQADLKELAYFLKMALDSDHLTINSEKTKR